MPHPNTILKKYGLRPKRTWGQRFVVAPGVLERVVRALGLKGSDVVVEIGAGVGNLTERLVRRADRVVAVERDRELVRVLEEEFAGHQGVRVLAANAVTLELEPLLTQYHPSGQSHPGGLLKVVGNLPYQLSSRIIFRLVKERSFFERAVLMLQREMAERLCAEPGSRVCGALTVLVGAYLRVKMVAGVPAAAFYPQPRVDSAIVSLTPRERPLVVKSSDDDFRAVVNAAFSRRRKTIRNALKAISPTFTSLRGASPPRTPLTAFHIEEALTRAGIEPTRRPETLSVEEFDHLAGELLGG